MATTRKILNLRVAYLTVETSGHIACRWKDGKITGRDKYDSEARLLIRELAGGAPGDGSGLDYMEFKHPTRILYYLAMDGWTGTRKGFRFNGSKPGSSTDNDTFSDEEVVTFGRTDNAITVINANENHGKPVGTIEKYGYDLIVKTDDGMVVIIDPEGGNDGASDPPA
jgi:hypothetical protein